MISDSKSDAFARLTRQVQQCTLCPRMRNSGRIFGYSHGQLSAKLMFVGEAPGRLGADDTAIPFHGDRAGENFERLTAQVGISRYDCFITNAVLCNPKDEKGNNATPSRQEVVNCSRFLTSQIEQIDPQIIVTLGAQALHALRVIAPHSLELSADVRKAHRWNGRTLIPLYHPGQRAMLHRSFLNQLADYQFVSEQLRKVSKSAQHGTHRQTHPAVANIARLIIETNGRTSYFRLHKLFYLLEYHYVRQLGHRLTNSYAIRQKDGPYFTDLHISKLKRALPELLSTRSNDTLWLSVAPTMDLLHETSSLNRELQKFVVSIVERYCKRTDDELKTAVYMTRPMRTLLRQEKYHHANLFNAPIDFSAANSPARAVSTAAPSL